ncbi:hypothetical protein L7F22_052813 [Adiantum nelumboides]|nr:hypothetical protein [Adiantum nelumboides]
MGIPKFFRFMSERYPLISQLVEEKRIPEFDNLYLDMNGIIHNCSHPNDADAHFRMSEADMFLAIFSYIEHIFAKIKPQKLFFLAIDGVAPRAKMNQQRSRRFRTAQEAKELREKAEKRGEELPEEEAFDSNCITPGTPFMARLSAQLKYFLAKKVTEDALWRDVEIVLSGHDVPGEGEHKIMEYIRLAKAQPDYNKNVRHCMYGLDADLIMLGLLTHDPHFALLREEVNFGPSKKRKGSLETQNFFLLHLSLFREYLDLEFQDLKSALPFEFSLERIIDDFILLNIFVGNDFLPHLPGLHINEGALDTLFRIYMRILPKAGGYINEDGVLKTGRLAMILSELTIVERDLFEEQYGDISWSKQKANKAKKHSGKGGAKVTMTAGQRLMFEKVKVFLKALQIEPKSAPREMFLKSTAKQNDQIFLQRLAGDLGLDINFDEYDPEADAPAISIARKALFDDEDEDEEIDPEAMAAVDRVIKRYEEASQNNDDDDELDDEEEEMQRKLAKRIDDWKRDYYRQKLGIDYNNDEQMKKLTYRYIEGLQWVLHYYYDGVASWGWFYDYHYAPMISDLKGLEDMKFDFELGKPFRPFDQLMGVLPSLSNQHIPPAFRDLMTDPNSPIIDFYPTHFEADFNGKKQSWEAVVKIPFIDEKRLLTALDKRQPLLSAEEKSRNGFGESVRLKYSESKDEFYGSSLPGIFPDIAHCKADVGVFHLPTLDGLHLVKGLCDGVGLGVDALAGFPSIKTLPHYGRLGHHGVNIFQSESRNQSIVINVENTFEDTKTEDIASSYLGNRTFVGWPFLTEGIVMAVSDELFLYEAKVDKKGKREVIKTPHEPSELGEWKRKAARIENQYSKRFGVLIGDVQVILHVRTMLGLKRMEDGSFLKEYEPDMKQEVEQAIQLSVASVTHEDRRYVERAPLPLPAEFPEKSRAFYLGPHAYGSPASIVAISTKQIAIELISLGNQKQENELIQKAVQSRIPENYYPAHVVGKRLGISSLALSKLTSSMLVESDSSRTNIGLNLKFEAKGQKVIGYSRRSANGWEFSDKTVELIRDMNTQFPEIAQALMANRDRDLRSAEDFFGKNASEKMKALKQWIKEKGVRELEAVPLFAEQLDKQSVHAIESLIARINQHNKDKMKRIMLRGVPRSALLKPSHAPYRLTSQKFTLGDRVVYVSNTGNVPLSSRGVVIGISSSVLDIAFDQPFLAGTTLDDRCRPYCGGTVPFATVLNLSQPQFVCKEDPLAPAQNSTSPPQAGAVNGEDAKKANGSVKAPQHPSALQRTLISSANVEAAKKAKSIVNGQARAAAQQQSYRPPSGFRPARPTGPAIGTRGAGLRSLGRDAFVGNGRGNVDANVPFAGVASGQARPRPYAPRNGAVDAALNPHLAALNLGLNGNAQQGRGGGRGGGLGRGTGRPFNQPRGRGRGGFAAADQ